MASGIQELHAQLQTDVEATEHFLLAAIARGDTKATGVWQATLAAGKDAHAAVARYLDALNA
jgi:hypothetical protein